MNRKDEFNQLELVEKILSQNKLTIEQHLNKGERGRDSSFRIM